MDVTKWILLFSALFPWTCVVVAALMTPRLTRPDLFFAVTVQPSFRSSPAGEEILRGYNRLVLIFAVLGLLPMLCFVLFPSLILPGLLGPVAVEMVGLFWAFLVARRRTLPYHVDPTSEREAQLAPRQGALPGGWPVQAGPFVILAVVCFLLWLNWDKIPAHIPIHWNVHGNPDGWSGKNVFSIFGTAFLGVLICSFMAGICYAITHGVRRINSSGAAGEREARFIRVISFALLGLEYWFALLMGMLSLTSLRTNPFAPLPALWLILLGETLVVGAVFFSCWMTGQGGWRLKTASAGQANPANAAPVGDRTPDECWKLGLIYYNQNDPALFVEKRFGIGWTLNFANPGSWVFMGAMLLFMVLSLTLALVMGHGSAH